METFQDLPTSKRWSKDLNPETFWLLVQRGIKHDLEGKTFLQVTIVTMRN